MKQNGYPQIRKNVYLFDKTDASAFLYDPDREMRLEIDDELLCIVQHLDGFTDPYLIDNYSEEDVTKAIQELEKYDLFERPEKGTQWIVKLLRHPNMLGIMAVAIMVDSWFTRQKTAFLLAAAYLFIFLIVSAVIHKR